MKQQTGMSIEYTTQMTCFFNLCAYFVAIFPEHNSDSLGTEQVRLSAPDKQVTKAIVDCTYGLSSCQYFHRRLPYLVETRVA